jgi:adenosylmethionine-8-amino-7-oxononanoate aminotransferase
VAEPFYDGRAGVFRHGYTYSGHAVASAAAHANLDIMEREGLLDRVRQLESPMLETFAPLAEHPLVSEVRAGVGLLGAVQVDPARRAQNPALTAITVLAMRRRGVVTRALVDGSIQISPPFIIDLSQLQHAAEVIRDSLDEVAGTLT